MLTPFISRRSIQMHNGDYSSTRLMKETSQTPQVSAASVFLTEIVKTHTGAQSGITIQALWYLGDSLRTHQLKSQLSTGLEELMIHQIGTVHLPHKSSNS